MHSGFTLEHNRGTLNKRLTQANTVEDVDHCRKGGSCKYIEIYGLNYTKGQTSSYDLRLTSPIIVEDNKIE